MKVRDFVIGTLLITAAVSALRWSQYRGQVAALKAAGDSAQVWADSVKANADSTKAAAQARARIAEDSVAVLKDERDRSRRQQRAAQHTADSLDAALKAAPNDSARVVILTGEVVQLRSVIVTQAHQLTLAEAETAIQRNRAIKAENDVTRLTGDVADGATQIRSLNAKIQALNPPPTLVFQVFTWATRALAVKGAIDLARGH